MAKIRATIRSAGRRLQDTGPVGRMSRQDGCEVGVAGAFD